VGYAASVEADLRHARDAAAALNEIPLGGTAVGTGVNRPRDFPSVAIGHLNSALGTSFTEARNHVEASSARDGMVEASGHVRAIAIGLSKIADDIRWMASGPRSGIAELRLPAVQPGSSIMPGKVNPVMSEALIMVSAYVVAADVSVALGGLGGHFELNTMMPLMAHGLLTSIEWLGNAARLFVERCIEGLEVDEACCERSVRSNLALATALAPVIGYDGAAEIASEAHRSGRTVREVALERAGLPEAELDRLLDARRMTEPDD
jgi:fumarate hydratase class II